MKQTVIQYVTSMGGGGAETLVKEYALLLKQDGIPVKILATRPYPESANSKVIKENQIPYEYVYPKWNFAVRVFNKLFGRWYRPFRVLQVVRKENAKAVHVHLELLRTLKPISRQLKDVNLLYTCHSVPEYMFTGTEAVEFAAAEHLLKHNDLQMIALHEDMRRELNEMFHTDTVTVIRNGIRMERFTQVAGTKQQIRKTLGIPEAAFLVGHVGRFSEAKNHSFLLDIFSEVQKIRADARLLLVGAGELREQVDEKINRLGIADSVMILSGRTDIPRLLKAMDVFVFPSVFEGLPVSLIEAQAVGLRCIVSDVITEESFVTNQVISLSVRESPEIWAKAACGEMTPPERENRLMDFDMNREIKRLEAMYLK